MKFKAGATAVIALSSSALVGAFLNFLLQLLVAKSLTVSEFGVFSSTLSLMTVVAPLASFGIGEFWLSIYGKEGANGRRWLDGSFKLVFFSTLAVLLLIYLWAWFGPHERYSSILLSLFAFHVIGHVSVSLVSAKYQLSGENFKLAIWQLLPNFSRFTIVVAIVFLFVDFPVSSLLFGFVYAVVGLVLVFPAIYQMRLLYIGDICLEGHSSSTGGKNSAINLAGFTAIVKNSWPFGMAGLFYLVYFQSDIVLVRYIVGAEEAGAYSIAFVILSAVYLVPSIFYQKFLLPKLHRWAHHSEEKLASVYGIGNKVMLALGVSASLFTFFCAPLFLSLFFGDKFYSSEIIVLILSIAIPFRFISTSCGSVLSTKNNMRKKVRLMASVAIINLLLNVFLIPVFGAIGAAVSTVMCEILLCFLYAVYSRKIVL